MFRAAVAGILGFTALGVAIVLLRQSDAARFLPSIELMPLLALLALAVSIVAVVVAARAIRQAGRLRSDIVLLARSIDIALKDVLARTDREAATLDDMAHAVSREIDKLSERVVARDGQSAAQAATSGNIVPYPFVHRPRGPTAAEDGQPTDAEPNAIEAAYRKAVAAGEFDISLEPIVSVARGSAAGFEVFANLPLENGQRFDLRRPAEVAPPVDAALFERILLKTALQAGRRKLGAASAIMPLHVAISGALLSSRAELDATFELLRAYPDLAQSFVLSVPAGLLDSSTQNRQALEPFTAKSVRLAVEGWSDAANARDPVAIAGVSFVKISANRLLDRERPRRRLTPASSILDQASAGRLTLIATGVESDEDAVALIDLGIDLMSGPRFGGPKRFKPEGGGRPGKLALI